MKRASQCWRAYAGSSARHCGDAAITLPDSCAPAAGPCDKTIMSDESRIDSDDEHDESMESDDIQPMSFNIFVLSLNASALIHLGQTSSSETGKTEVNMPLARQTIDILSMLEEKTRGNLTGEEERLLHQILFDLRMRYSKYAAQS
jgi:hypothetical protein